MTESLATPVAKPRQFLPTDFKISDWESLQPYFEKLQSRTINNADDLHQWLADISELEAVISEDASWRQIRMTLDTTNPEYEEAFTYFVTEMEPKMKPYFFSLNKKLTDSPYAEGLDKSQFFPYLRSVRNSIELYREENISIQSELSLLAQQYGVISSKMTI